MKDEQREENQHGAQGRDRFGALVEARSVEETGGTDESIASVYAIGLPGVLARGGSHAGGSKCRKMDNRWNRRWEFRADA